MNIFYEIKKDYQVSMVFSLVDVVHVFSGFFRFCNVLFWNTRLIRLIIKLHIQPNISYMDPIGARKLSI